MGCNGDYCEIEPMESELKPCPFCGGKEVLWQNNYQPYSVFCRDCHATIESKGDKLLCLAKWNRRVSRE